jgi:hypothetical protein
MPHPRTIAGLPLLALVLLAGACTGGPFDASGARAELRAARAAWQRERPADYAYTVGRVCYCGQEVAGPVRVEVRGGRTVSVQTLAGQSLRPGAFDGLDTVEELFDAVGEAIEADPYHLAATYDPERGHPLTLAVDYDRWTVDEEGGFVVSDFTSLP